MSWRILSQKTDTSKINTQAPLKDLLNIEMTEYNAKD